MATKNRKTVKNNKTMEKPQQQWNEFFRGHVAGLQYYSHQLANIKAGDTLSFVHERNNPHSPHAVAIYCNEHKIGHVKDPIAQEMVDVRDFYNWRGSVVSYNPTNPTWQMCVILIERATKPIVVDGRDSIPFN